jgi:hypothetical protein
MDANALAQQYARNGFKVLRVSEKSITVEGKNGSKKLVRVGSKKQIKQKKELNWNLISCAVVIACGLFIMLEIRSHTASVERIQNELELEKMIYKIESQRRMK